MNSPASPCPTLWSLPRAHADPLMPARPLPRRGRAPDDPSFPDTWLRRQPPAAAADRPPFRPALARGNDGTAEARTMNSLPTPRARRLEDPTGPDTRVIRQVTAATAPAGPHCPKRYPRRQGGSPPLRG